MLALVWAEFPLHISHSRGRGLTGLMDIRDGPTTFEGLLSAGAQTEPAFPPALIGMVMNSWLAIICNGAVNRAGLGSSPPTHLA